MSELRMILRGADENSLILGDELCSGTETESALSIFMAGLMHLHEKRSSYIFATHFHEILHYDELRTINTLAIKHMAVEFDREHDCLIYHRKLRDGTGNKMYGLEVCKSLYLPDDFLENAYSIRNKYYPVNQGELAHGPSTYNAKKIRGICEICKLEMGEEVHHLSPQKDADENGFIGSFHKNHVANLLTVCEKCHDQLHSKSSNKIVRKKSTKGYIVKAENG
jgi:DNA mismatch repair protein MutS